MATSYEVRLRVRPRGSATALRGVLARALADARAYDRPPQVEQAPPGGPDLQVRLWLLADDTSTAQLEARDAVRRAVEAAGLPADAVTVGDPSVAANS